MKKYKYRHELKFKISNSAAEVLKQKLSLILGKDKNAYYEDGSYLIKSLYFDNLDSTSYYEKMDGVLYRKKYRIRIYNDDETQIVFVDTPGIHKPIHKLGKVLNKQAYYSIDDVDIILFLVDASVSLGKGDKYVLDKIKE